MLRIDDIHESAQSAHPQLSGDRQRYEPTMLKSDNAEHLLDSLRGHGAIFKVGRSDGSDLRLEHNAFPLLVSRNHAE